MGDVLLELLTSEFELFFGSVGFSILRNVFHELVVFSGEGLVESGWFHAEVADSEDCNSSNDSDNGE